MNLSFYTYIYHDRGTAIYVGKGKDDRAHDHLKLAKNRHFDSKLAKMKREGREPYIQIIDAPDEAAAFEMEELLIAMLGRRDLGTGPLCNMTDGGEGWSNPSEENRIKMKAALAVTNAKPEVKLRKSLAAVEAQNRPETKAKIQDRRQNTVQNQEYKNRISASLKQVLGSPEVRAKMSASHSKPCELHGEVFPSRKAAIAKYGQGGIKHSSFRYL